MQKGNLILAVIIVVAVIAAFGAAGYFVYQHYLAPNRGNAPIACTMEAKICPDGSSVGRSGPNCEFAQCPDQVADWKTYKNNEYGFELTLPDSWKNYSVVKETWKGWSVFEVEDVGQTYSGTKVVIKNPQTNSQQIWQDIPIMIFTPEIWKLVNEEKIAVSAAPIGPAKIGENAKYIFATPPRWYGFTDDKGWEEAVEIVKTFKAF